MITKLRLLIEFEKNVYPFTYELLSIFVFFFLSCFKTKEMKNNQITKKTVNLGFDKYKS